MKLATNYRSLVAEVLRDVRERTSGRNDGVSAGTVLLVDAMLETAIELEASDLHIEPVGDSLRIRFRLDGQLIEDENRLPLEIALPVISRLKIMAKMDIARRNLPQDGQLRYPYRDKLIDMRVATLPVVGGERVVIRLLDYKERFLRSEELGFTAKKLDLFRELIRKPTGLLLLCGPMNSGKTTTLYAGITELNVPEYNIITLEDPVERKIDGVNQLEINPKAGLTFLAGLRAVLRQDAQKILLGEIRDKETAEMAVRIALTGHALFSTLHTDNAVSAVFRMLEMGVQPYILAATLSGVVAQRLVRRICTHCREEYPLTDSSRESLIIESYWQSVNAKQKKDFIDDDGIIKLARGRGCEHCKGTGYRGRLALQEMLIVDEALREAILESRKPSELYLVAERGGMETLWQDGIYKVLTKEATLEEIERVLYGG